MDITGGDHPMMLDRDGLVKYNAVNDTPKETNETKVGILTAFIIYFPLKSDKLYTKNIIARVA